jgi:signal transduction histidine kinase
MPEAPIRVIHLEDNAQDAELVAYAMEAEGMQVSIRRVEDKAGYIQALRAGDFDLILSDHSLPAFSGSDALELAKEIRPDAPFIFVSGKMGEDLAVDSLKQGAMDYVLKQSLSRLPSAVERALQQARTRKEKRQAEKLASLGQLSAGVAHEINNPMAFVTSNLRTLASYARTIKDAASEYGELLKAVRDTRGEPGEPGETDDPLALAREKVEKRIRAGKFQSILDDLDGIIAESLDGAQRVNEIVHSLKSMARVDGGSPEPTDVNRCLEDALKLAWNELKYKCAVEREFGDLPMVQGHPGQLKQVFINLLVNAAQAIPEKGTIYIRTAREKDRVTIEIEDTGTGIAEADMPKLFTPFFTTKPVGQGTGLGLPISYGIIQGHRGGMDVRSRSDRGTTFIITLPIPDWTPCGSGPETKPQTREGGNHAVAPA